MAQYRDPRHSPKVKAEPETFDTLEIFGWRL